PPARGLLRPYRDTPPGSKIPLQRQVPLLRRPGLTFGVRLPESRQVEFVQEVLFVRQVRRSDGDEPAASRRRPLEPGVDDFVAVRAAGSRKLRRDQNQRGAYLALAVDVEPRPQHAAVLAGERIGRAERP